MAVIVIATKPTSVVLHAKEIQRATERLLDELGMGHCDVRVVVRHGCSLGTLAGRPGDPIELVIDRCALEDSLHPEKPASASTIATVLGRALLRVRDRMSGEFEDAPDDEVLTLARAAAWDAYAVGRLSRLGYPVHEPRWVYHFRNGHGFTARADAEFAALWQSEELTWAALVAHSDAAAGQLSLT